MQWVILSKLNIKIKWTGHAGPMGAEQSNLASEEAEYAFHVLRVDENSPAAVAKLVPHFDYIVSVNGVKVVLSICKVIDGSRSKKRQTWSLKWPKTIWTGR